MDLVEEAEERVDRYRTLNNAVFGLALGLGAFSLTGFPIGGLEDVFVALTLFAIYVCDYFGYLA